MDIVDREVSAFCNRCGAAVLSNASVCAKCGAGVVPPQPSVQPSPLSARQRKTVVVWLIVIRALFGRAVHQTSQGIVWRIVTIDAVIDFYRSLVNGLWLHAR